MFLYDTTNDLKIGTSTVAISQLHLFSKCSCYEHKVLIYQDVIMQDEEIS